MNDNIQNILNLQKKRVADVENDINAIFKSLVQNPDFNEVEFAPIDDNLDLFGKDLKALKPITVLNGLESLTILPVSFSRGVFFAVPNNDYFEDETINESDVHYTQFYWHDILNISDKIYILELILTH
jgi:hypothetical protein